MSRKRRLSRRERIKASRPGVELNTYQVKQVQGPQTTAPEPQTANVALQADLLEKYLGRGLVGLGPSLEVLTNSAADPLLRQHGYQLYRQMLADSEVDASLDLIVQASSADPVTAISPLDPTDPDFKLSQELADFVNYVFECIGIDTWRREQTRTMLAFGNATSEIDFDWIETGRYANHLTIKELRLQLPEDFGYIIDRWGEIYGVAPLGAAAAYQFTMGNLVALSTDQAVTFLKGAVPRYKLAIWTWEKKGTDPRGTSALIPAYIPWWAKQRAIEEWACWLGRYSQPSIWATPGPDAVPICLANGTVVQPTENLLNALMQFKSASVLALPYGSEVNLLQVSGGADPFINSIRLFNTEITRAILGQHLATNEGASQSRAAADVHALILRMMINSLRRFVGTMIVKQIIKPVIEGNYGDVGRLMPTVDLGDGDGWPATITEIAVLMQSGYFSQDQLRKLDKKYGLPVRETNIPTGPAAISQAQGSNNDT